MYLSMFSSCLFLPQLAVSHSEVLFVACVNKINFFIYSHLSFAESLLSKRILHVQSPKAVSA